VPGGWSRRRARRRGGSGCAAAESSPSSVLLDSGVEEFPPLSPDELEPVLAEIAALGSLLIVHAEDAEAIDRAPAAAGYRYADFLASRPRGAENLAIAATLPCGEAVPGAGAARAGPGGLAAREPVDLDAPRGELLFRE
jgi:hypothetical protein